MTFICIAIRRLEFITSSFRMPDLVTILTLYSLQFSINTGQIMTIGPFFLNALQILKDKEINKLYIASTWNNRNT